MRKVAFALSILDAFPGTVLAFLSFALAVLALASNAFGLPLSAVFSIISAAISFAVAYLNSKAALKSSAIVSAIVTILRGGSSSSFPAFSGSWGGKKNILNPPAN